MFDSLGKWAKGQRLKNMVWTVSEDHTIGVNTEGKISRTDTKKVELADVEVMMRMGVKEEQAYDSSMYAAAHEGAHVRLSKAGGMRDLLKEGRDNGNNVRLLNGLAQICEDYRVDWTTIKERPGYQDLRNNSMSSFVTAFGKERSGNDEHDTTKAISALTYGVDMRTLGKSWRKGLDWGAIEYAANTIMDLVPDTKSTREAMKIAREIYDNAFTSWDVEEEEEPDTLGEAPTGTAEDDSEEDSDEGYESGESGSAEEDDDVEGGDSEGEGDDGDVESSGMKMGDDSKEVEEGEKPDERGKKSSSKSSSGSGEKDVSDADIEEMLKDLEKSTFDKMTDEKSEKKFEEAIHKEESGKITPTDVESDIKYGIKKSKEGISKELWTPERKEDIRRRLCRGIHAGADVMYGESSIHGRSRKEEHRRISIEYADVIKRLEGQAKNLASRLKEDMRASKNVEGYISDSGSVIPNACWKPVNIGDNHVFNKVEYDEEGGFVVDLVLDASGSQRIRENGVRQQAFVVARACKLANIPCRVTMFDTVGHFTVLRRLRDFDDEQEYDLGCFRYSARADNRDGLALMMAYEDLKLRPEQHKIMLVLSDGQPSDASGYSVIRHAGGAHSYSNSDVWKGDKATTGLMDTARVIRDIRNKGVALMGIYVGGADYTLRDEKKMFGNDFAYIGKDMKNFGDIIGNYLHKQIMGLTS